MRSTHLLTAGDRARLDTASDWIVRLQESSEDDTLVSEWLEWYSLAENREAFDEMCEVQEAIRSIGDADRAAFVAAIQRRADIGLTSAPRPRFQLLSLDRKWLAGAIALCGLTLLGLGAWKGPWLNAPATNASFQTARAIHREEKLADGSVVKLGADSSVSLNFTREARYLVLEKGEAFFQVAKDSSRPFVVQAGPVRVKAVGTQFNVRRSSGDTFVSVKEGVVEVSREGGRTIREGAPAAAKPESPEVIRVAAGEQAIGALSHPLVATAISKAEVASWQEGRLEFVDEPLESVIATVNRYSKSDIVLTEPAAMARLRFTGVVMEGQIDDWVSAIQQVFQLKASTVGEGTILLSPSPAPSKS